MFIRYTTPRGSLPILDLAVNITLAPGADLPSCVTAMATFGEGSKTEL